MPATDYVSAINVHICRSVVPGHAGGHVLRRLAAYENQALVYISGLGLNFQLFVLRLPCTFQGILQPPHLACLIKGNKAGYQSTCIPKNLKYNELSNFLELLYASI